MAKYTGPKSSRADATASILLKSRARPWSPSATGKRRPGSTGDSPAPGVGLCVATREKQKLRFTYGVLEQQFRRYYEQAARRKGGTGENLLKILESRLDNVTYRMGFGCTRAEARQLVGHKGITVNGKVVSIPSYQVRANDIVAVRQTSQKQVRIQDALTVAEQYGFPDWVDVDAKKMQGVLKYVPERGDLPPDINESLVVALYSK